MTNLLLQLRRELFPDICYRRFFVELKFTDVICVKLLISKLLGYAIILGAFGIKIPQIIKIQANKSVAGISMSMYLLETVGFLISSSYGYVNQFPFSTYGESLIILIQNYVVVYLMFHYTTGVNFNFLLLVISSLGFLFAAVSGIIPFRILQALQGSSIVIFSFSKIPQIINNAKAKSTGQLAFLTFFLNFVGSAARIFTTLQELSDWIVLTGAIFGTVLNGIIVLQILIYGNVDEKKKRE
jgi:mannose-P-dolichol utilization defect protein 1